jgi:hypothetical protein
MPRPPDGWFDQMIAEQEARKEQEKRQKQRREELKRPNAGLQDESKQDERAPDEEDGVPRSWLYERLSSQQAGADNTRPEGSVPFGGQNDKWERLKASLQTGDEIWAFCSPPESWERCAGGSGVAVVRKGRVVDCLVTMMN